MLKTMPAAGEVSKANIFLYMNAKLRLHGFTIRYIGPEALVAVENLLKTVRDTHSHLVSGNLVAK